MYNFFSNRLKLKAFKKALKQVEAEGFYVDLTVNENTVPVLPDVSKAVASLSKSKVKEPVIKNVVDLSEASDSIQEEELLKEETMKGSDIREQSRTRLYESLFSDSPTLLNEDLQFDDIEFLDPNASKFETVSNYSTKAEVQEKIQQQRKKVFAKLSEKNSAKSTIETKSDEEQNTDLSENGDQYTDKLVVEIVAKPSEKKSAKPKTASKQRTTRKKKRKLDADIVGDFDF